jgi:hypothetical protein
MDDTERALLGDMIAMVAEDGKSRALVRYPDGHAEVWKTSKVASNRVRIAEASLGMKFPTGRATVNVTIYSYDAL